MNDKYIAQAPTQEEAIIKGLNALGITRDEATIKIEEPGKKGFFGIGQKDAVVVVERKEKVNLVDEFLSQEFNLSSDKKTTSAKRTSRKEVKEEQGTDQATTEDPKVVEEKEEIAKAEESQMTKEEFVEGRNPADVEIVEEEATDDVETETEDSAETIEISDQEAVEAVRVYLEEIILAMDISDAEVYTSRVGDNVRYDVSTENAGLVIGRHGKVLNGLQTLAQNHMHQLAHSKLNVRVDAEKYRERRKSTVETLAERTADKVIKTNKRVKLEPMPAHERKQIHRYLNRNPKVQTHSEGREPKRYLVVEPAED